MFAKKTKFIFLAFSLFSRSIASSYENLNSNALASHERLPIPLSAIEFIPENSDLSDSDSDKMNNKLRDYLVCQHLKQVCQYRVFYKLFDKLQYNKREYETKVPRECHYNDYIHTIRSEAMTRSQIQKYHNYRIDYFRDKKKRIIPKIRSELAELDGFISLDKIEMDALVSTEKNFIYDLRKLNSVRDVPDRYEIFNQTIVSLIKDINQFDMLMLALDKNKTQKTKKERILEVLLNKDFYLKDILFYADIEKIERYIENYINQNDTIGQSLEKSKTLEKTEEERIIEIIEHRDFFKSNPLIPAEIAYLIREYRYVLNEILNSKKVLDYVNYQTSETRFRIISYFENKLYKNFLHSKDELQSYVQSYLRNRNIQDISVEYSPVSDSLILVSRGQMTTFPLRDIEVLSKRIEAPHRPAIYRSNHVNPFSF